MRFNMNFVFYLHDEPSIEQFEKKLLRFKKKYNIISFEDFSNAISNGIKLKNSCLLTVDDGWRSTYDVIFPVIKKHKVPITIFVSPKVCKEGINFWYYLLRYCNSDMLYSFLIEDGYYQKSAEKYPLNLLMKGLSINDINKLIEKCLNNIQSFPKRAFINEIELLEMYNSGLVEVGAHTMNHPILANESDEISKYEILKSVEELSLILKAKVRAFAYPNGLSGLDFTKREYTYLREAGISYAFSTNPGSISSNMDFFNVPRIGSERRLAFGELGCYLPSSANQTGLRNKIIQMKKL